MAEAASKKLNFLVTGKTGVGKSRLVNALVGSKVAEEGHKKYACTKTVQSYEVQKDGVQVTVWDSPGLQDGTENEEQYVQEMSDKIKEVDLVIYCLRMDDTRLQDNDKKAMRIMTEVFEEKIWSNAVFAMTFANKVEDPDAEPSNDASAATKYFEEQLQVWSKIVREFLKTEARVTSVVVDSIPIIPTAIITKPDLPGRKHWFSTFWLECYATTKIASRLSLLEINTSRVQKISGSRTGDLPTQSQREGFPNNPPPIFVCPDQFPKFERVTREAARQPGHPGYELAMHILSQLQVSYDKDGFQLGFGGSRGFPF